MEDDRAFIRAGTHALVLARLNLAICRILFAVGRARDEPPSRLILGGVRGLVTEEAFLSLYEQSIHGLLACLVASMAFPLSGPRLEAGRAGGLPVQVDRLCVLAAAHDLVLAWPEPPQQLVLLAVARADRDGGEVCRVRVLVAVEAALSHTHIYEREREGQAWSDNSPSSLGQDPSCRLAGSSSARASCPSCRASFPLPLWVLSRLSSRRLMLRLLLEEGSRRRTPRPLRCRTLRRRTREAGGGAPCRPSGDQASTHTDTRSRVRSTKTRNRARARLDAARVGLGLLRATHLFRGLRRLQYDDAQPN